MEKTEKTAEQIWGCRLSGKSMAMQLDYSQEGVTPIDSIVTAATELSQRSTVKPSE